MHAGHLRRQDHLVILALLEAADIGRNRVGEQLDVLGQITEMLAERRPRPAATSAPSSRTAPAVGAEHADDVARQRGLAGARGADNSQHFARLDAE